MMTREKREYNKARSTAGKCALEIEMEMLSKTELSEAARAITSALHKSDKAILKLKESSPQFRMIKESIRAYQIALQLIERDLGAKETLSFSAEELLCAQTAFSSMIARVEKILPKFAAGTPQHTLAVRRIRAFEIAWEMILRESTAERA
jgi:hypothetical protein